MNTIKLQLKQKLKIEYSPITKVHYSKRKKLIFLLTDIDLMIYKYPTFELIYELNEFFEDFEYETFCIKNIFELENGNFLFLYGEDHSRIEVIKFNEKNKKSEIIQTIIENEENWDKSYTEMVKN